MVRVNLARKAPELAALELCAPGEKLRLLRAMMIDALGPTVTRARAMHCPRHIVAQALEGASRILLSR